jgi:hypothetical protein
MKIRFSTAAALALLVVAPLALTSAQTPAPQATTMCTDGTTSTAVGKGACSGHGGVKKATSPAKTKSDAKTAPTKTKSDTKAAPTKTKSAGKAKTDTTKAAPTKTKSTKSAGKAKTDTATKPKPPTAK